MARAKRITKKKTQLRGNSMRIDDTFTKKQKINIDFTKTNRPALEANYVEARGRGFLTDKGLVLFSEVNTATPVGGGKG